jgi:hypothetical protein
MSRNQVYESHGLAIAVTGRDPLANPVLATLSSLFTTVPAPQPLDAYNTRHDGRPVRYFCRMVGDRFDNEGLWRHGGDWQLNRDARLLEEAVFTACPQLVAECARQNAQYRNDMLLIRQRANRARAKMWTDKSAGAALLGIPVDADDGAADTEHGDEQ